MLRQFIQHGPGGLEIFSFQAFRKRGVERFKEFSRFVRLTLTYPNPAKTQRSAQFQRPGSVPARHFKIQGVMKTIVTGECAIWPVLKSDRLDELALCR